MKMKKAAAALAVLLAGGACGPDSVTMRMDGPAADIKHSDGWQHVAQRLDATHENALEYTIEAKAKWDTAEEVGNEKLDGAKKYAGDRDEAFRDYATEKVVRPMRCGSKCDDEAEARAAEEQRQADLARQATVDAEQDEKAEAINLAQDLAIEANNLLILNTQAQLTAIAATLAEEDASLWQAIQDLTEAVEAGDEALAQLITDEIASVNASIATQAAKLARTRALGLRLYASLSRAVSSIRRDVRGLQIAQAIHAMVVSFRLSQLGNDISELEDRVEDLENANNAVGVIDPCGNGRGPDEVVLVLEDGSLVAWYKNKGLVALSNGNYITTDSQRCRFTVRNGQILD